MILATTLNLTNVSRRLPALGRVLFALLAILALPDAQSWAIDGAYDPGFGTGGVNIQNFGGRDDMISSIAVMSDGSILTTGEGAGSRSVVARFLPNGVRDNTYGGSGTVEIPESSRAAQSIKVGPDSIQVGYAGLDLDHGFFLGSTRVNVDGTIDTSFGGGYAKNFLPSAQVRAGSIVQQANGKFVVAGSTYADGWDFALARFNANGTVDETFGNDGVVLTNFGRSQIAAPVDRLSSLALDHDGKLVAGGFTSTTPAESTGNRVHAVARYTPDGVPDASFGDGGQSVFTFDGTPFHRENVADILVLPDNRLLLASSGGSNTGLVMLLPDGSLDTSFGSGGRLVGGTNDPWHTPNDLALDAQGRILVAGRGSAGPGGPSGFALARLLPNGRKDPTFINGGIFTDNFGMSSSAAHSILVRPDGRILVGGYAGSSNSRNAVLVQLVPEPSTISLAVVASLSLLAVVAVRRRRAHTA